VTAASRKCTATGLLDLRVLDDSTLPPLILQPGDSDNQDVKCLAVGQRPRSVPHSDTRRSARLGADAVDLRQVGADDLVQ